MSIEEYQKYILFLTDQYKSRLFKISDKQFNYDLHQYTSDLVDFIQHAFKIHVKKIICKYIKD